MSFTKLKQKNGHIERSQQCENINDWPKVLRYILYSIRLKINYNNKSQGPHLVILSYLFFKVGATLQLRVVLDSQYSLHHFEFWK